ncbi:MAG: Gfo/Idh/MocA family oxidoreductase, partial [Planctomycetaceae bacterium]|nr:Gfo/Idh/MocA family oxidoreductase [Planctomycetaceae bacterium]
MSDSTRRSFLKTSAALGAASLINQTTPAAEGDGLIAIAVIGTGGMGMNHVGMLSQREDVRIVAVCDVDTNRLQSAVTKVEENSGRRPDATGDLRDVLKNSKIEAVFIATPDHWHGPAAILALDAGKHVYVEKPCCHNIREGRLMTDAVARSGKVLQVGTQSRSTPCVKDAIDRIHAGEIGEVLVAKAWNS